MSAAIQTGNKIIVGGYSYNSSSPEFTILRYNPDGSLDNNFNGNGIVITQASSAYNRISGIALDGDRLYAAGFGQYPGNFGVVARYNVPSEALPVTLAGFTATLQNKLVLLQWQTESEQNLLNFDVERSNDGRTFSQIGDVAARGNSSIKINYSTIDRQPLQGINIYRLKIFDKDGEFRYSKIVSVNVNSQNTVTIFPNPAGNLLFVQANGNNEAATLVISDVLGKKLRSAKVILNGNIFTLDISDLRKGTYNLVLFNSKGIETQQFIKQ